MTDSRYHRLTLAEDGNEPDRLEFTFWTGRVKGVKVRAHEEYSSCVVSLREDQLRKLRDVLTEYLEEDR